MTVKGSEFKIGRMVAAVDCGQIVNPESVRSQTEGAIVFGLSAALKNEITINNGAVEQTNFDGYDPLRMNEAPHFEVYLTQSADDPGGRGGAGVAADCARGGECDLCVLRPAAAEVAVPMEGMNRDFTIKTPLTAKVANPTSVRELQTQTPPMVGGAGFESSIRITGELLPAIPVLTFPGIRYSAASREPPRGAWR